MISIDKPNYTQTPNVLFDDAMKNLSDAELRVLLAVVRKTFGWGKTRDRISLTQIQEMTGLSRQGVINGKTGLIKKSIINEFKTPSGNEYEVNVIDQLVNAVDQKEGEVVNEVDQTSQRSRPKLVNVVDTQKKINKLSKEKEREGDKSPTRPQFVRPLVSQIDQYITEQRNAGKSIGFTAEKFFDYYESKGWIVGKAKMKDWKAAVRTWINNGFDKSDSEKRREERRKRQANL